MRKKHEKVIRRISSKQGKSFLQEKLHQDGQASVPTIAQLLSNRAMAYMKMKSYCDAIRDARDAINIFPCWSKLHHRLSQAQFHSGLLSEALQSCEEGLKVCSEEEARDFHILSSQIRLKSLLVGSPVGLSGRILEVRSAGEEAWLGLPAPEDPELDNMSRERLALLDSSSTYLTGSRTPSNVGVSHIVAKSVFRDHLYYKYWKHLENLLHNTQCGQ